MMMVVLVGCRTWSPEGVWIRLVQSECWCWWIQTWWIFCDRGKKKAGGRRWRYFLERRGILIVLSRTISETISMTAMTALIFKWMRLHIFLGWLGQNHEAPAWTFCSDSLLRLTLYDLLSVLEVQCTNRNTAVKRRSQAPKYPNTWSYLAPLRKPYSYSVRIGSFKSLDNIRVSIALKRCLPACYSGQHFSVSNFFFESVSVLSWKDG